MANTTGADYSFAYRLDGNQVSRTTDNEVTNYTYNDLGQRNGVARTGLARLNMTLSVSSGQMTACWTRSVAKLKTKKLFSHKRYKNLISLFEHLTKYIYKLAKISELI